MRDKASHPCKTTGKIVFLIKDGKTKDSELNGS
jgi:hypothetical protein